MIGCNNPAEFYIHIYIYTYVYVCINSRRVELRPGYTVVHVLQLDALVSGCWYIMGPVHVQAYRVVVIHRRFWDLGQGTGVLLYCQKHWSIFEPLGPMQLQDSTSSCPMSVNPVRLVNPILVTDRAVDSF